MPRARAGSASAWRTYNASRPRWSCSRGLMTGSAAVMRVSLSFSTSVPMLTACYTASTPTPWVGRCTPLLRRRPFSAWMSYDSAPESSLAQRYFIQALRLAQAGDDRLLGASILDAMSHQATYTGRYSEAANLARAAMTGARGVATATLTAHFHAMEARALARLGDAVGCDHSLAEAVREFEKRRPEDDPEWIRYFNAAELSAEMGHCLRDLGRPMVAAQYASDSLIEVSETTFVRSDFFAMMVLADSYLAAGEVEKACSVALHAITAGEQIRSARCIGYLRDFRERLAAIGASRSVSDFHELANSSRLWRIASQSGKGNS